MLDQHRLGHGHDLTAFADSPAGQFIERGRNARTVAIELVRKHVVGDEHHLLRQLIDDDGGDVFSLGYPPPAWLVLRSLLLHG